jgi:hypothetical protein
MIQRQLLRLLLSPSLFSGTGVCLFCAAVMATSTWQYISTQQLFYDYLFSAYGFETYLWQQSAGATAVRDTFLASPIAYYILVSLTAAAAGLAVYTLLQGLSVLFSWRTWSNLAHLGSSRRAIMRALLSRTTVRILALLGWAAYGAFFFSTVIPFMVMLSRIGIDTMPRSGFVGWLIYISALVMLVAATHLNVIFARLVFLRPRLFYGAQAIEEATANLHDYEQ